MAGVRGAGNAEGARSCVHVDARTEGKTVQCGSGAARRMAAGGDVAALESGVGQVRSGRYHRLCAPPSTDFHFPSVTPPRSGSGWRHQPPSLRRFPTLNVRRKTSSEFRSFPRPRRLYTGWKEIARIRGVHAVLSRPPEMPRYW